MRMRASRPAAEGSSAEMAGEANARTRNRDKMSAGKSLPLELF